MVGFLQNGCNCNDLPFVEYLLWSSISLLILIFHIIFKISLRKNQKHKRLLIDYSRFKDEFTLVFFSFNIKMVFYKKIKKKCLIKKKIIILI